MRRYELMLLLRPDLEDDKLQSAVEKVTRAIVNAGGSLSKVSPWGKRRLAYEINHHRDASYFLIHFDIEPSAVRGIERGLLISEEILRHLVTVIEDRGPQRGEEGIDEEPMAAVPHRATSGADETDAEIDNELGAPDEQESAGGEDEEADEQPQADETSDETAAAAGSEGARR